MESRFTQQLKKGVLEMVVLCIILEKDTYGYELLQELGKRGEGFFDLKEGTLYPILYRLEDDGLIQSSWKQDPERSGGRRPAPKKYYRITEAGSRAAEDYRDIWKKFEQCVDHLCGEGEV